MKITILTLFPEMFDGVLNASILKRALGKQIAEIKVVNIRDYTKDPYGRVDTPPIGGGAGLIMKCQPIIDAMKANSSESTHSILLSPRGKRYDQIMAQELSSFDDILIVCGHYEGIDERVNKYIDEMVSIGDFVMTGGEIAAMAIIDSVIRLKDGAISNDSLKEESFSGCLLEYPQYTEPADYMGQMVPNILYCGNHQAIEKYHRKESIRITRKDRPDLFSKFSPTKNDIKLIKELDKNDENPKWLVEALEKGKKFTK